MNSQSINWRPPTAVQYYFVLLFDMILFLKMGKSFNRINSISLCGALVHKRDAVSHKKKLLPSFRHHFGSIHFNNLLDVIYFITVFDTTSISIEFNKIENIFFVTLNVYHLTNHIQIFHALLQQRKKSWIESFNYRFSLCICSNSLVCSQRPYWTYTYRPYVRRIKKFKNCEIFGQINTH